jgi:hypothetical protein
MIVCVYDVAMIEPLDRLELAFETRQRVVGANQLEVKHFDRDEAAVAIARRSPHLPEAAFAEQTIDVISRDGGRRPRCRHQRVNAPGCLRAAIAAITHC